MKAFYMLHAEVPAFVESHNIKTINSLFIGQAACKEDGSFAFPEIQEPFLKVM